MFSIFNRCILDELFSRLSQLFTRSFLDFFQDFFLAKPFVSNIQLYFRFLIGGVILFPIYANLVVQNKSANWYKRFLCPKGQFLERLFFLWISSTVFFHVFPLFYGFCFLQLSFPDRQIKFLQSQNPNLFRSPEI